MVVRGRQVKSRHVNSYFLFLFYLTLWKFLFSLFLSLFLFFFLIFFSYLQYQPQFYYMISIQYKVVEMSNIMHVDRLIRTCVASKLGFFFFFVKLISWFQGRNGQWDLFSVIARKFSNKSESSNSIKYTMNV